MAIWQTILADPWVELAGVVLVSMVAMSDFYRRFQTSIAQAPRLSPLMDTVIANRANQIEQASQPSQTDQTLSASISVIIPAYNESVNIEDCMRAVLANDLPKNCELQLIVVDDRSTDDTPAIAHKTAANDSRVHVLTVPPRPADKPWRGKNWACHCGVQQATGDYLLFIDADVRLGEQAIARALQDRQTYQTDLLSCAPAIVCGCFSEWLVQPIMANLIAIGFDFAAVNDAAQPDIALAAGPFMLFDRSAYDQIGGHDAVATDPVEDLALARRIKSSGLKLRYVLGLDAASVRMYRSFGALWEGWTKNYHLGGGRNIALTLVSAAAVFLIFVMPWLGLAACGIALAVGSGVSLTVWILCSVAVGLQVALRLWAARVINQPLRYGWLGWLGGILVSAIAIASLIKTETGWGWTWRGRSLADSAPVTPSP